MTDVDGPGPAGPASDLAIDKMASLLTRAATDDGFAGWVLARYGFAVPTAEALNAIAACSPNGVIEVGAGTGYWAALLAQRDVDVVAHDRFPPPSIENRWFAGVDPWHPVQRGDERDVDRHRDRSLLLVWPTRNETWATVAVERYHAAGGHVVLYVGQGPGGRTGDDSLHARLGQVTVCLACRYGAPTVACICKFEPLWALADQIELPAWQADAVSLRIFRRAPAPAGGGERTWSRRFRRLSR